MSDAREMSEKNSEIKIDFDFFHHAIAAAAHQCVYSLQNISHLNI